MQQRGNITALAALLLAMVGWAAPAAAQGDYFGRNPVQWERLKFEVLKTDHFDVYYYHAERAAAEEAGRLAERWYERLSKILDFKMKDRQPLILYASQPQFQQTNTLGGAPGEGTGGVTEAYKRRIVLPVGMSLEETDHVIGHELVHAFQYAITGQGRSKSVAPAALNMPLWFIEGMAEYLSLGPVDPNTAMWMRDAAANDKLPKIDDLNNSRYFPYRYGQALWAYLAGRYGDRIFAQALRHVGPRTNDADLILKQLTGVDVKTLSKNWQESIQQARQQAVEGKSAPSVYGGSLVTKRGQGGTLNVGPALSPDGSQVAFLSERDLFSIELFVQDVKTGRVERRLSHAASDPHVESLGFIYSAGAWDPSGKLFVLGEVSKGRPSLSVVDVESGNTVYDIPLPTLGEVASPSFSPDGQRIVFSALAGGFSDLYVYDLKDQHLTRLTDDPFADLQPAWSPDGKTIAFVTDRFTTKLESLAPGDYRLAALDVETHVVRPLPSFSHGKNINPQWDATGRALYFIAEPQGVSNLYRLDVASGELFQVTDLKGGVSGITGISPALSVAARTSSLAYSVYDSGRYEIYSIDDPQKLVGTPVAAEGRADAGVIPGARAEGQVMAARADSETGLPDPAEFKHTPYKPHLTLDYIGQPYLSGGIIGGQGAFAGGASMTFSDMLGEHDLGVAVQAEHFQGFSDIGGVVNYVNRTHRFNWGAELGQTPYIYQSVVNGITTNGQFAQSVITQREIVRSASLLGIYPFDVATRVEAQVGLQHIGFDANVSTDLFDAAGNFLGNQTQDLPNPLPALDLGFGSVALVRDTAILGATSPVTGTRMRFEVSPVVGTVDYAGIIADVRGYTMPTRPVTLAARVLHYGRYGSGADSDRLFPLFLGDPGFVRGYSAGSFDASECGAQTNGTCPVFDRLIGSRLLMANVEVRAPLVGLFSKKDLYGPIPIELGAFFDAGVAWDTLTKPTIFGGDRKIVKSAGIVGRLNLLGFAIVEADLSHPFDRPGVGHVFQVNLLSGF